MLNQTGKHEKQPLQQLHVEDDPGSCIQHCTYHLLLMVLCSLLT